jgi:hypothetical protein
MHRWTLKGWLEQKGGHLCHLTWGPQTGSLTRSITGDYGFTGSMPHTYVDFETNDWQFGTAALAQSEAERRFENVEREKSML